MAVNYEKEYHAILKACSDNGVSDTDDVPLSDVVRGALSQLLAKLSKSQELNEFFRDSVGECHLMISRNTPEYQVRTKWESYDLPPRLQKIMRERADSPRIEDMVNRFLAWRLPDDFNPDGGISFTRDFNEGTPYPMKHQPIGTNLFSATQAEAMVRHMLHSVAAPAEPPTPNKAQQAADFWQHDPRVGSLVDAEPRCFAAEPPAPELLAKADRYLAAYDRADASTAILLMRELVSALRASAPRGEPRQQPPCAKCGGPHPFDTVLPSEVWNATIRANGLPDYLCLTCIVEAFGKAAESFNCELWGEHFSGVPMSIHFNNRRARHSQMLVAANTDLRRRLSEAERACKQFRERAASGPRAEPSQPNSVAAPAEPPTPDPWQPIATAPKDGTGFLAVETAYLFDGGSPKSHRFICYWWRGDSLNTPRWNGGLSTEGPTHWMPLPAPPAAALRAAETPDTETK